MNAKFRIQVYEENQFVRLFTGMTLILSAVLMVASFSLVWHGV